MKMLSKSLMVGMALLLASMLALVGCSSGVSEDDFDALENRVNQLENDVDTAQADAAAAKADAIAAQSAADSAQTAADSAQSAADAAQAAADAAGADIADVESDLNAASGKIADLEADVETLMMGNVTPPVDGNVTPPEPPTCDPSERVCAVLGVGDVVAEVTVPPMSFGKLADLVNGIAAAGDDELQQLFDTTVYAKIPNIPAVFKALLQMLVWMIEQGEEESECFTADVQPLFELAPALAAFSETDFTESPEGYGPLGEAVDAIGHAGLSAEWAEVEALIDVDLEEAMSRVVQMEGWMCTQMYNASCGS